MKLRAALASLAPRRWSRVAIAWLGGLFIAAIVGLEGANIYRGYHTTLDNTGRELSTQARVIAEQTARSLQAVDVVLRHLEERFRAGELSAMSREELRAYLRQQSVGLVQIDGLLAFRADGRTRGTSYASLAQETELDVSEFPPFVALKADPSIGLFVGDARQSSTDGQWVYPLVRRLESPSGEFAGVVAARGRVTYFEQFYRDVRLDQGTTVALMQRSGRLLARHPSAETALGRRFPLFDEVLAAHLAGDPGPRRTVSPIDGVERFAALQLVPDYPIAVVLTREVAAALAPWREQSKWAVVHVLLLSVLAALLLAVVMRQLSRLYEARERFALAVAGSDDGIWDFDFVAKRVFISARARELSGMPPGPEMQAMDEWFAKLPNYIHPEDLPRREAALAAHMAGRTPTYEVDLRHRHSDGTYRWTRIRGICTRAAAGQPLRMAGSVSDIDARKRAEEALRESEERFALAIAGANDGIVDWDIANGRMFMSERAREILGVESEISIRPRDEWMSLLRFHPEDVGRLEESYRWIMEGQGDVREGEYRLRRGDGAYRWVRIRGRIVRDAAGRSVRWAGSVSDIDAQKSAEAALRESETRYQLAFDGSNQGLWDWHLLSDRLFLSPRAQEFMGLEPGEPLRPRREWIALSAFHPDDREEVRTATAAHLRGDTPYFSAEYRLRRPSGDWHWYRQRGVALRDDRGRAYRMAGSMEDITEQKRAEEERSRLEGQLLQAKKLEAIGTLAGGIAHDFNNILSAILGYGEMAQKDASEGAGSAKQLRRHIDAAMSAAMRAKSLVERILAFSRSGIGERAPVHVQSVVAEALDLVAASLAPQVRLERRLEAGDAAVLGDPTQIHQVVMNLCTNGVQAMKSKGTLAVSLDLVEKAGSIVATSALPGGSYVRLCVRDTGAGIAPGVLERIFDPFFTTKQVGVGTGLGLSLVHGIVTDLGGGIEVESHPGEGAAFTVYLPRSGSVSPSASIEEVVPNGAGETVLFVDDEEPLVRLGEEMIAGLGYEPVGFASAAAALHTFRASPERFHAVLSDEAMPDMTGSELAKEIRAIRPDMPIVLMSGYVSPALLARARELGVAGVLAKPLVERDIARGLASALGHLGRG